MSEGEKVVRGGLSPIVVVAGFVRSSVGSKVMMALSGALLWAFIIVHLLGNLQILQGSEPMNAYGVFLRELAHGAAIWVARVGIVALFVVHIFTGIRLAAKNRAARGAVGYAKKRTLATNMAAMSMALGGVVMLTFLVFHLAHFTWGFVQHDAFSLVDEKGRHDVFRMVQIGFKTPWIVGVYVIGQAFLFAHLFHGTASLFQSLGVNHPTWTPAIRIAGRVIAALILLGNVGIPLAILLFWDVKP